MSVREWPTYLLRDIPEDIRARIEKDASSGYGTSMIEVVREILCSHYELDCEAVETSGPPPPPIKGTDTMLLRVQPALFSAIKKDAEQLSSPYGATRKIVLQILTAHYNGSS
jgi:hypothetical protein